MMTNMLRATAGGLSALTMTFAGVGCSSDDNASDFGAIGPNGRSTAVAFPTGDSTGSVLMIDAAMPDQTRVGEPTEFQIEVTNISELVLEDVRIIDDGGQAFRIETSEPASQLLDNGATMWPLGRMVPDETKALRITAVPRQPGEAMMCLTAQYQPFQCLVTTVTAPELELIKTGPAQASICDPLVYTLSVRNTGIGPAEDVRVVENLPEGMRTEDGRRQITWEVGDLGAGETEEMEVRLLASSSGMYTNIATATSGDGLQTQVEVVTQVTAPRLQLTKTGPSQDYIGVPLEYQIVVENVGDAPAEGVTVYERLASGLQFEAASLGGEVDGEAVRWELGSIAPGQRQVVTVAVRGTDAGMIRNTAVATAECAEDATATAITELRGIPALLLEVVDTEDPVRVGNNTSYVINVTNQGSEPATGVVISFSLEDEMDFVEGAGATAVASVAGDVVDFAPLPELAPGASAEWRVTVTSLQVGDVRFRAQMTADQLQRPVRETEATRLYQ